MDMIIIAIINITILFSNIIAVVIFAIINVIILYWISGNDKLFKCVLNLF